MQTGFRSRLWPLLTLFLLLLTPSVCLGDLRIGVIMSGDIPYFGEMHQAFVDELHARLPAGEKVEIILQRPFPDPIAWSNAARKLIAVEVDLIVTYGLPAVLALLHEKSRIPVVFAGVYDPERAAIKGDQVTGCGFKVPLSSMLRYFKQVQTEGTFTVVFSGIEEDSVRQKEELRSLAAGQQIKIKEVDIRAMADLEQLGGLTSDDTVLLTGSSLTQLWLTQILAVLDENKVPVGSIYPDPAAAGVLIALFQPPAEQGRKAAAMAARILQGEKPGAIAPEVLRDTELVFNLVQAQHLGITFPIQLIVEATRVIK